jgi:predicted aconitase with swiveling domain
MSALGEAKPLLAGEAGGEVLALGAPLSFWGGVDPMTGRIIQVRHPQCGESIAGKVLAMPGTIGSSSSAAVLLELIRNGNAPAALLLDKPDAILLIGCLVAKEMGWSPPPAFQLAAEVQAKLPSGRISLSTLGRISAQSA